MMKALFVYKYCVVGGVETVLRGRLEGLAAFGVEAHAWFLEDYGGRAAFPAHLAPRVHVGPVAELRRFLHQGAFDVTTSIDTEELAAACGSAGPPLVLEVHTAYTENLAYLRRWPRTRASVVFVPSRHQGATVRERLGGGVDVRVVPNPVPEHFLVERKPVPSAARPIVCWIGRLDDHKNWQGFVATAGELAADEADAEFWVVGRPVQREGAERLKRRAAEQRVLGKLRWWDGLPPRVMPALLDVVRESGGVVLTTSHGESFGMTVAEAMARGCAVVVPDSGPFDEFVESADSRYRPGSARDAARCTSALLADAALRAEVAAAGRRVILERFVPERALAVLARELHEATAAKPV